MKRKNEGKAHYYETPWAKRIKWSCGSEVCHICEEAFTQEWRFKIKGNWESVCDDGLIDWDLDGVRRIKICLSSKPVKGANVSYDPHHWVPEKFGFGEDPIYWWVEVDK